MSLATQFTDYVNAAFAGIYVQTSEPDEAEREIAAHCRANGWTLAVWDIAQGIHAPGQAGAEGGDPLAPVRALPALAVKNGTALLILHNYHKFMSNPEVAQTVFNALLAGKSARTFLVILAPVVQIPTELEKLFVTVEHDLPSRPQLAAIANELIADDHGAATFLPDGSSPIIAAAAGLTRYEAEGAFALSLAKHDEIRPDTIWELKAQALKKSGTLTLHRPTSTDRFDSLGGLAALKTFTRKALAPTARAVKPRGILLLGVPGTGKSAFAKALGQEIGRPTLLMDLGALYGSLVGQTEANVRQSLRVADAMAPALLFVDEIEKGLSGLGGAGDSGVSTRLFGTLLTWLSDHTSEVFFIGTCNNIAALPPEFSRAERFDAVYFLDLPTAEDRETIWTQYLALYGLPVDQTLPDDAQWTGAEIKSCCRLSALLDVSLDDAATHVVPVALTAAEQIAKLQQWADGRCLDASRGGIYRRNPDGNEVKPGRRAIQRGGSGAN